MKLLKNTISSSIIGLFLCAVIFNIFEGICRIWLADNTGSMVNAVTTKVQGGLEILLVLGLGYSVLLMISIYIKEASFARTLENVLANIRDGLYYHLVALDYRWLQQNNTNELVARISNDLNALTDALRPWIVMSFSQLVIRVIYVGYLLSVNWFLTLILLSIIPIMIWIQKQLIRLIKEYTRENQNIMGRLSAIAGFCYQNRELLKAMAIEMAVMDRFQTEQQLQYRVSRKERAARAVSSALGMATRLMTILILFGVGAYLVSKGQLNIGELITFYTLSYGVIHLPSGIVELLTEGQRLKVCLERMEEVYQFPKETEWKIDQVVLKSNPDSLLEFHMVSFAYGERDFLLREANFIINPGETVLLTGDNGSGKSTILNLIVGLNEIQAGNIFLSGINIQSMSKQQLRSLVCYIPQEPVLFFGTIYENVTCFRKDINRVFIAEILERLGLGPTLERLPEGLDYQVGEQGSLLSGGERQRILIARCFLKEVPLILLDEIAAGLEEEAEDVILSILKSLPHHPAILYISHRDIVSRETDRVLHLKDGKVQLGKKVGEVYVDE